MEPLATFTVVLTLPPPGMNPNRQAGHFQQRGKIFKARKRTVTFLVGQALGPKGRTNPPRWNLVDCRATFYFADRRRRDSHNFAAALKADIDAMQDCQIFCNDAFLTLHPPGMEIDPKNPRLEITITPRACPGHNWSRAEIRRKGQPTKPNGHTCTVCGLHYDEGQAPWERHV